MTSNIKILVVDDEPTVLESFKMILTIKDYEVDAFLDGPAAFEKFKTGVYDIAFIDMKLPKMDGLEILKRLKELEQELEVVIVTAYATDVSHSHAINLGALEYLRKPFLMEEIYELVDRAVRRRRRAKAVKSKSAPPSAEDIH
ncbi:MAG: response regulator [Candidatus Saganbacteria bacterium]|nr:response regulator [Candidatus Saganbacteria bacterium]